VIEMYTRLAEYYDRVYATKDYAKEVERVNEIIQSHQRSSGVELLDVACGTGKHIEYLKNNYHVTGLDISEEMLAIARKRNSDVRFVLGDMKHAKLKQKFDIITCLFESINYNITLEQLKMAFGNLAMHLKPGGVILIEPIFTRESFIEKHLSIDSVDDSDMKIARVGLAREEKGHAVLELQYLIATQEGIVHHIDTHRMGLFTRDSILDALRASGLASEVIDPGLGRESLYIGVKHE
jgi:ubiquinone/menaquinone biosynthesis C-methylase UbiE